MFRAGVVLDQADPVVTNVIETVVLWMVKHEDGNCSQLCTTLCISCEQSTRNTSVWLYSTIRGSASLSWRFSLNRENMQQRSLLEDQSVHRNNVDRRSPFDLCLTLDPSPRITLDYTTGVQCQYIMIPRPVSRMSVLIYLLRHHNKWVLVGPIGNNHVPVNNKHQ